MRRVLPVVLLVCVVLSGAGVGIGVGLPAGAHGTEPVDGHPLLPASAAADRDAASTASDPDTVRELQQEFDRTEFRITVHANGSAEWTFRFKRTLENDTQRRDFRAFADEFNNGSTELYTDFQRRARALTAEGANATGRPMDATDFSKRAFVDSLGNQGIVEMSFRWTAFAPVADDGTVTVADVFEGGLYIRADQRLVVSAGEGLVFEEVSPGADSIPADSLAESDSITWEGERSFTDERPRIVLAPPSAATGTATPDGGGGGDGATTATGTGGDGAATGGPTSPAGDGGDALGLLPVVGLGAVVLLGLGAAFAYRSGMFGGAVTAEEGGGDEGGAVGAVGTGTKAESEPEPEPSIPDAELLSDEDRVIRLLDDRGGRMKQVEIVEETGWSKSKVSMLLSDMEDEEQISKLRVGRENIISKKGMEPEAAGSPFENEDD